MLNSFGMVHFIVGTEQQHKGRQIEMIKETSGIEWNSDTIISNFTISHPRMERTKILCLDEKWKMEKHKACTSIEKFNQRNNRYVHIYHL